MHPFFFFIANNAPTPTFDSIPLIQLVISKLSQLIILWQIN